MTCKKALYNYIQDNPDWHKKVELYVIAEDWSPETVGRRLRELEKAGDITRGTYDGKYKKNLVKYILKGVVEPKPRFIEIERDGERVMIMN